MTCGVVTEEELVAYWASDLPADEVDRLDEHLVGCAPCTAASERISAVTEATRAIIPPFLSRARLEALRAHGTRVRPNRMTPGERKVVIFDPATDILLHELGGLDLANATTVSATITVEETGDVLLDEPSVPFDPARGEVLVACQRHFAALPPNIIATLRARDASGAETVARYTLLHVFQSAP